MSFVDILLCEWLKLEKCGILISDCRVQITVSYACNTQAAVGLSVLMINRKSLIFPTVSVLLLSRL